jgi:hypothetical protein
MKARIITAIISVMALASIALAGAAPIETW